MIFPKMKEESSFSLEQRVAQYWREIDLLKRSDEVRENAKPFVFYEGPPTANGHPGIHHVISRALKDAVCRYKVMTGHLVKRKAGWDTHGLPVEIEVEKKLGLTSKQDIEEYGVAEFNQQCRESVFEYESLWREMTEQMGYLIDLDNPYITLDNNYIETVWYLLDQFYQKNMIYEGHSILPYCPRCGTGLASHEVAQGYIEIVTETAYVKFKIKDRDAYFLAWTTTPWTLAANVSLTVHPDLDYVLIEDKRNNEKYILAEALVKDVIGEEYTELERFKGRDLEGWRYEQIMPFVEVNQDAFFVTLTDYVTVEDGTGIVHTAPAFGQDDYDTGEKYNLPVVQPVDLEGKYTTTPWKGMNVFDADHFILHYLADENKLYEKKNVEHNYPHCWRCKTPLIYYARPSWYIRMTAIKDELIEANKKVEWYPDFVGEKRFGNWLENLNDWALSRTRYWGTPLNIWRCDNGHTQSIGSLQQLREMATEELPEEVDLHRPFVDDIKLKCPHCGQEMQRVPEVIDCWFDSGAMPFAQHHYPFENEDIFMDELFPADFICEAIDQTRGWFYSLLAISVFLKGESAYKRVLVNDLILDKKGQKMSKSLGNTVNPFEMFKAYGADAVRWYLLVSSPPWVPKSFDPDGVAEVLSKYFNTLKNSYTFFELYANTDGINPRDWEIDDSSLTEIDRWILSKYNSLLKKMAESMDKYDLTAAARAIQEFLVEDFSNWYIRRNRRRFWVAEETADKRAVFTVTYRVLVGICQLTAPFAPFMAEEIYRYLTGEESVHLTDMPLPNDAYIDEKLEEQMDLVRTLVKLGRAARTFKVRQPIRQVLVDGRHEALISDMTDLIKEELNVKEIVFVENLSEFMTFSLKPNYRTAGPRFQKDIGRFNQFLQTLDAYEVSAAFNESGVYKTEFLGEEVDLDENLVIVDLQVKEGFNARFERNVFVILDTVLTPELIQEGLAREFVSKIQQLRKTKDLNLTDRIHVQYCAGEEIQTALDVHMDWIMNEVLAESITMMELPRAEGTDLNGLPCTFDISKV